MTTQTYTHNGITLTQPMVQMLGTWAIGNDGWLVVHHGITVGALIRRGLAEKVTDQGYRITDAGRAWLAAYEAERAQARAASLRTAKELRARIAAQKAAIDENRDAAAQAEEYESAADKEREEARAEELDHDAAPAKPRAYIPGPIALGLIAYYRTEIRPRQREGAEILIGFLRAVREAVRIEARTQNLILTDGELTAWVRQHLS